MATTLGLAIIATAATLAVICVCIGLLSVWAYVLDNWDEVADLVKAAGAALVIFIAWCLVIGTYKFTHKTTTPAKAEVKINLTETLQ